MSRFYKINPRYYRYGGQPMRYEANWKGVPAPSVRSAESFELGDASFPDSWNTGTYNEELQESYYPPATPRNYPSPITAPSRGGVEPLSPQMYPAWQLKGLSGISVLGLSGGTLLAVGGAAVAAVLLLRKKKDK